MPSVSEGDLSDQAKQKHKKDYKKRPVSDVPAGKKGIEGLPPPVSSSPIYLSCLGTIFFSSVLYNFAWQHPV